MMADRPTRPTKGRHRAPSRWARHNPAHQNPETSLLTRVLPSWKFSDEFRRPARSSRPGVHREEIVIDDRSGPEWETPSVQITIHHPEPEPTPSQAGDVVDLNALESSSVDSTELLPPAANEEPSSSLASLFGFSERQVSFVEDWDHDRDHVETAWDSLPSLADVAVDEPTGTGETIQRLWDATEELQIAVDAIEEPVDEPQTRLIDDQKFRRSAIIGLVVVLALVFVGIRQLGSQPERAAVALEAQYQLSAAQINEAIGPVARSVELLITDGLSVSDFSQLTSDLDVLDGIARDAAGIAAQPLPESNLVGSSLPIDELVLPRSLLEQSARQALNLEERIGDAVSYRIIFDRAFDLPPLPTEATIVDIGVIGSELSVTIAENELIMAELPDDPFFGRHRQEAVDLLAHITEAQNDYFTALREGDTFEATRIRDDIINRVEASRASLAEPLAATEAWALEQVEQLRRTLDELLALTGA